MHRARALLTCCFFAFTFASVAPLAAQTANKPQSATQEKPAATTAPSPPFKISGYMFGDFYWMPQSHSDALEGQNGFWFRRIYFTYDHTLSKTFSARFRLEMNSSGDFATKARLTPYIKDAYLRWTRGRHNVLLGISPTPTWEFIESFWGYRSVEKTPLDLQRFDGSRDFGVAFQGALDEKSRVRYHVMIGNGSDTGSETDKSKTVRGSLGYRAAPGFVVEGYADWQDDPGRADRSTVQGFIGYQKPDWRAGLHAVQQARRSAIGGSTHRLEIASGFAVVKLSEKVWALARVDRMFDPNPDGARIPYLPFDTRADSLLAILGVDFLPDKNVHLIPNIEIVRYGEARGVRPSTDVVPRVTFYFIW